MQVFADFTDASPQSRKGVQLSLWRRLLNQQRMDLPCGLTLSLTQLALALHERFVKHASQLASQVQLIL